MNRQTLFSALACALLAFSMGCGSSNHLQSIQLSTSNTAAAPPGTLDLVGIGGTIQLYTWGNYSSGKQKLLANQPVAFQVSITPDMPLSGDLATPPETVTLSPNGLLTAVPPFVCTWVNSAVPPATSPAWGVGGSYTVTATYLGFTSPPVFVAVASASAGTDGGTNPTGECGPPPTS
ncbi:MAG: hypothetical protein ABSF85_05685 [Terriglobales bacterium]